MWAHDCEPLAVRAITILGAPGNIILFLVMIDKNLSGSIDNFATPAAEYQTKYRAVAIATGRRKAIGRAINVNVFIELFINFKGEVVQNPMKLCF